MQGAANVLEATDELLRLAAGQPQSAALYGAALNRLEAELQALSAASAAAALIPPPPSAARGAIGGVEALLRRELAGGRAERLPELLPDVVYGALVPFLDQQEALRYAELAREHLTKAGNNEVDRDVYRDARRARAPDRRDARRAGEEGLPRG